MAVLVLQSHRAPLPAPWFEPCLASVRDWAALKGYDYRWLGDELFDVLPETLRAKLGAQPVVASDLARLRALEAALSEHERVVWLDADTLVVDPERLELPAAPFAFGRELWVQRAERKLRVFDKIHNAFMVFDRDNPMLTFYGYAAERLLLRHEGPMVPQLAGPKFLATLNNVLALPVLEAAGVLSPLVVEDLLAGGGEALELFRSRCRAAPAALNLCASMVGTGALTDGQLAAVVELLSEAPERISEP